MGVTGVNPIPPFFKIQIDTYHLQISEGSLSFVSQRHIGDIGHIQIGDVPGRHQPGTGAIDFAAFFRELDSLKYKGYLGLEYIPLGSTQEALEWLKDCESWPSESE